MGRGTLLTVLNQQLARRGLSLARGLTGEFVLFSVSTLAYQFSRLAVSLIVAHWVGPEEFGIWNALNLLLLYGALVTFGVPNGMNRDVPLLMGQGDKNTVQQITNLSFWFVLFSSVITGLTISFVAVSGVAAEQYRQPLIWMGLLFLSYQVYLYFQLRLKCSIQFHLMSLQQVVYAILLPILVLPMAREWQVSGFIVGHAVTATIVSIFISQTASYRFSFFWSWSVLFSLVKVGFPIMAAGVLYGFLISVDRWVILTFLNVESLGYYSLAIICLGILSMLPAIVSQQMYPRMAFRFGQTGKQHALLPLIIQQSLIGMLVTVPILAFVYLALPVLVTNFLPAYAPGLGPARILLIGLAFIPLAGGIGNFLNTVGKQIHYLAVQMLAVGINLGLDVLFVSKGYGLEGVALGATATYVIYSLTLWMVGLIVIMRAEKISLPTRGES